RTDRGRADRLPEAVLQLQQQLLRALLPDAGYGDQCLLVTRGDRSTQGVRTVHGEHRLGQTRTDPARGLEQFEDLTLVVVREPVQRERVLADDQGGRESGLAAHPESGERVRCALEGE